MRFKFQKHGLQIVLPLCLCFACIKLNSDSTTYIPFRVASMNTDENSVLPYKVWDGPDEGVTVVEIFQRNYILADGVNNRLIVLDEEFQVLSVTEGLSEQADLTYNGTISDMKSFRDKLLILTNKGDCVILNHDLTLFKSYTLSEGTTIRFYNIDGDIQYILYDKTQEKDLSITLKLVGFDQSYSDPVYSEVNVSLETYRKWSRARKVHGIPFTCDTGAVYSDEIIVQSTREGLVIDGYIPLIKSFDANNLAMNEYSLVYYSYHNDSLILRSFRRE